MSQDEPWLQEMRERFLARLPAERAALVALRDAGDRQGIVDRAHKLAGIAGTLGAPAVGDAALALDQRAHAGSDHAAELAALIAAIDAAIGA